MFDDVLIESAGRDKKKGGWVNAIISTVVHIAIIGAIVAAGLYVKQNPEVITKPIHAYMVAAAPPPPPPPPPAASHAAETPKVETPKVTHTFHQPTQTPREVPQTQPTDASKNDAGVEGGVQGGVQGGVVGGVAGGVVGGTLGGQLGGVLGGTGDKPYRVGGNVLAPVAISRVDPTYTEVARKARISGIVIIEAIIDVNGDVTDVRVLKGLPFGLDASAQSAVKRWKFRPGTLNGQAVPVIWDLTVNFQLQ